MNANGTDEQRVTSRSACAHDPAFSPSGNQIVYSFDKLYIIDADGSNGRKLNRGWLTEQDGAPVWSPDGSKIAFDALYVGSDGYHYGIYTINPDGSDLKLLVEDAGGPDWSPDGTQITYTFRGAVHKMDADGTDDTRLTDPALICGDSAFSPGGGKIVFGCIGEGDNRDLYIMDADGTDVRQLTNGPANDFRPDWQPVQPKWVVTR